MPRVFPGKSPRSTELNAKLSGLTLLKGSEVDILADGRLDLPDQILSRLDIVVAAVHYKFDLSRAAQTDRVIRAMDNPYVNVIAHPTGRLIGEREPYDIDMERLIAAAKAAQMLPGDQCRAGPARPQ